MPELEDLAAFVRIVEAGGLGRAAARLGVSKSVVSRRLSRLEGDLGVQLLARTTRGVAPTEAGTAFYRRAERVLEELEAARDELLEQDGSVAGVLRLAVPLSFGVLYLAPVLAELAVANPRLGLDVAYSDRLVDLVGEGYDAAVRIGVLKDSSLVARRICPVRNALVASPDYLARHPAPQHPSELAHHSCILYTGSADGDLWRFRDGRRWMSVRVRGRVKSDNGEAMRDAAVAGLGIAALPRFLAAPALDRGTLVPILDAYPQPERGLYVVRPPGLAPAKVRLLSDLLAQRFGPEPSWDPCWNRADGTHAA